MPQKKYKKYLVTSALPYANGPLHFGHLAGVYIPADIYTRHRRLQGERVIHICGSDEHGVAIMLNAEKAKQNYKEYVNFWHKNHRELFQKYDIDFDFFGQTSEPYHEEEVVRWFKDLLQKEYVGKKTEKQLYCNDDQKYLPDRYVEGTCYSCGYKNARGDECPNCGEWIDAIRLKEPVCKICGKTNLSVRDVEHFYLLLTKLEKTFRKWFATRSHWRPVVTGFVEGLLEKGVIDRAITRNLEWGIDVPAEGASGKKLYVWFDAPIGYVSNTKEYLKTKGIKEDYINDWWKAQDVEISHFIGKDNIIFHAYIWPSMSLGTGFINQPTELPANQFVNLEGKQFSKSAGWYVDAEKAIETFGADALRFYLCSLIPESSDSSFSWDGFASSNEEFGNKVGNFVHRSLSFLEKNWPQGLDAKAFSNASANPEFEKIKTAFKKIHTHLNEFQFTKAQAEFILFSQAANEFFHGQAPWKQIKENPEKAAETLAFSSVYILAMTTLLDPFTPKIAAELRKFFNGYITDKEIQKIYQGDFNILISTFKNGFKPAVSSRVLIPRIDPIVLKNWKEELGKAPK